MIFLWVLLGYAVIGIISARITFVYHLEDSGRVENDGRTTDNYTESVGKAMFMLFLWPLGVLFAIFVVPFIFITRVTRGEKKVLKAKELKKREEEIAANEKKIKDWAVNHNIESVLLPSVKDES